MRRSFLSKPMQQAHADGILDIATPIFDYGCGHGDDIKTLRKLGYTITGWDPAHAPDQPRVQTPIINIGYVINVIEDPAERAATLQDAWALTTKTLIVSARLSWDPDATNGKPYSDGILTRTGTFQKYYQQDELRDWITATIGVRPITAAPGIFYAFKDPTASQQLLARQARGNATQRLGIAELIYNDRILLLAPLRDWVGHHRRLPNPTELDNADELVEHFGSIRAAFSLIRRATGAQQWADIDLGARKRSEQRFEEHLEDLQPLIDFLSQRGRLPRSGELPNQTEIEAAFGSIRAAFSLIRRVTGPDRWATFEATARNNFLVYTALAAFAGRPRYSDLPPDLQHDVKDLFGSYTNATAEADRLLYSIADTDALTAAFQQARFGKLTPDAFYAHVDGIDELPPTLRVYQGAARALTGNVDDTTIIKFSRLKPQVSFLTYPDFDANPHPPLATSVIAKLPELKVSYRNFANSDNPPILHRKEAFLPETHPSYAKYARLTQQEERAGLLSDSTIGHRNEWDAALVAAGKTLRGHRLINTKPPDANRSDG